MTSPLDLDLSIMTLADWSGCGLLHRLRFAPRANTDGLWGRLRVGAF